MPKLTNQQQYVDFAGVILLVHYNITPGSPGTRLDPPDADEYDITGVFLGAVDLLPVFNQLNVDYQYLEDALVGALDAVS